MTIHLHIFSAYLTLCRKSLLSPMHTTQNIELDLGRQIYLSARVFLASHVSEFANFKSNTLK